MTRLSGIAELLLAQSEPVNQSVVDQVKADIVKTAALDTDADSNVTQADIDAATTGMKFLLANLDYDGSGDLNKGKVYIGVVTATDDEIQLAWADA